MSNTNHPSSIVRRPAADFCILHSAFCISSRGQAMVELVVGLVVALVLIASLIQIGQLSRAHTQTMIDARREAGLNAIAGGYLGSLDAQFIYDWNPGGDETPYTHDDQPIIDLNAQSRTQSILDNSHLNQVQGRPTNVLEVLDDTFNPVNFMYLVKGHGEASIPTIPVFRRLFNRQNSIALESDVWLVWAEGIY